MKVSASISQTRYWRVKITGKVLETEIISLYAYSGLLNKQGVKYPSHKEIYTGRIPEKPSTSLKKNQKPRDPSFRSNYISWFEKKYPKANVNWGNYEIHHIRPLLYGGSNDVSNGIALTKSQHNDYTSWWKNY